MREAGTLPFLRVPAKWAIRKLAEWISGRRIPDLNTGMKVFKKDVMERYLWVLPEGFSCVTSMTLAFLCNGHPVRLRKRPFDCGTGILVCRGENVLRGETILDGNDRRPAGLRQVSAKHVVGIEITGEEAPAMEINNDGKVGCYGWRVTAGGSACDHQVVDTVE